MFKYAERLRSLCLRACGVRHPGRQTWGWTTPAHKRVPHAAPDAILGR